MLLDPNHKQSEISRSHELPHAFMSITFREHAYCPSILTVSRKHQLFVDFAVGGKLTWAQKNWVNFLARTSQTTSMSTHVRMQNTHHVAVILVIYQKSSKSTWICGMKPTASMIVHRCLSDSSTSRAYSLWCIHTCACLSSIEQPDL